VDVEWGGIYMYDPPSSTNSPQMAAIVQSGSEQSGWRPFVIVSRDGAKRNRPTAVGVPLSTNVSKANSYRILIPVEDIIPAGFSSYQFQNSVALCDHVRVLDLNMLRSKVGSLSGTAIAAIGNGLANLFDLR
jgi:mRNA-degrading endonuclease toxin of MazEF toxin-antitoxin module